MFPRSIHIAIVVLCTTLGVGACGPRAHIPARPVEPATLAGMLARDDSAAHLARALAPVLYLQRDEWFPLERVVAVVHPTRPIIAYHLLWRDDVHGSWIPFTVATDEEIVWVGFDDSGAPTDLWTFWHGTVLHTPWSERGTVAIDVQWGKHGSLPRGIIESDLPWSKKLNTFYAFAWAGIWDMWLGKLTRPGPGCFCHTFGRYREFVRPLVVSERIDVVARTEDARGILAAVFGAPYSNKRQWP